MRPSELIRRSTDYLERHGVESPRENAEAILAHCLGTDRAGLYARREGLDQATARRFGRALCRRCSGVPLQYITEEQQFLDLRLIVGRGVFVPRPETEGLVLAALETLEGVSDPVAVDVGTGSGAIALVLKHRRRDARVFATDRSPEAVDLARSNAGRLGLDVDVRTGNLLEPLPKALRGRVHLLVSNPPYLAAGDYDWLPPEVKAEPYGSLVGGTLVHRSLVAAASEWLAPSGCLVVEIGETQGREVSDAFRRGSLQDVEVLPDLAGRDRVVRGRLPG
ncbi:MAG: peptide chain release factor N(5)-glutamine methyltransferase [Actinobacteria bacterium]|nr:peptide chain release factor N(5)-glutamine methyltransferase [Actinomycetota bacterium]